MGILETLQKLFKLSFGSQLKVILVFGKKHIFTLHWAYGVLLSLPVTYFILEGLKLVILNSDVFAVFFFIMTTILAGITNYLVSNLTHEEKLLDPEHFSSSVFFVLTVFWVIYYSIYLILFVGITYLIFHDV